MSSPIALEPLKQLNSKLQLRFAALAGQATALRERQTALVKSISLAKARIDLAPAATEVFDILQNRAHKRAVGVFEELLSAFVTDVFPDGDLSIRLELGTALGAPSLDILLDNEGDIEDILDGNGGGLTNVVSAGLVFAALSRTAARPMVILDEPDCWLHISRVPAFSKVLAEVATKTGCQTLIISHHPADLMDPDIHRIELLWEDGKPVAVPGDYVRDWANDAEVGIRWIELENVRKHSLTHVPLVPGANALIGDSNMGKSTVFGTAMRAMAYGEMSDSLISHRADTAIIRMGLENQIVLEMERRRKPSGGTPKLVYRRFEAGVLVNEGAPKTRGTVPAFITDALRVDYLDGLDIQVRNGKNSIFLLDETPARRAQLLSVGRESGLLQAVIEKHRATLKRDREQVRRDETELNQVNLKLEAMAPLTGLAVLVELIDGLQAEAIAASEGLVKAKHITMQTAQLQARVEDLSPADSNEFVLPTIPPDADTTRLNQLIQRLDLCARIASLPDMPAPPVAAIVTDSAPIAGLVSKLEQNGLLAGLSEFMAQGPQIPAAPEMLDRVAIIQHGKKLLESETGISRMEKEVIAARKDEQTADNALHALRDKLGMCPLCQTEFKPAATKELAHEHA